MSTGKIYFDLREAVRVAELTVQAPEHRDSFADQMEGRSTGPALMWVKDAGTYLMGNGRPRPDDDVIYGRANSPNGMLLKQPESLDDDGWNDVWHTARDICGGDDFAADVHECGHLTRGLHADQRQ